jgi:hypothetical protein
MLTKYPKATANTVVAFLLRINSYSTLADEQYLPDWAKEKLAELQSEQSPTDAPDEDAGQSMKGM